MIIYIAHRGAKLFPGDTGIGTAEREASRARPRIDVSASQLAG